ncbi:serine hydrolase domain-containing protein [Curtobacterium sp. RRHDQ10]|uniref:serine hydrolase domain-containing protein n=1 Tax=Curtobacterium phyllosphaerae TaxID=3413379 RepID=UPI003BF13654
MTTTFPHRPPTTLDIDPAGIDAFVTALETTPGVEPHSLMLLRGGAVVTEGWWAPYSPDRVHLLYSLSKSFTSAAVGIAVGDGLVDLDAAVLDHFPELDADVVDPRSRRIRVRHLLAMASGHREETVERARALDPTNLVRGFLLLPPDEEPGTVFAYNQPCTYTLGEIVRRVTGGSLLDFLRPRLLDPLGIGDVAWVRDDNGAELGFSGLHATTDAIARLGQLYLQRGVWAGERILAEDWVDAATRAQVANPDEENVDWAQGYGFQFWMARHGYRGDGAYGQFCVVLPEHDVVLAMTGQSLDMQAVLDAAWTHLLPAIDRAGSAGAATAGSATADDDSLAARLRTLALPPVPGAPLGDLGRTVRLTPAADSDVRSLTGLTIAQEAPGAAWRATLVEGDTDHEVIVGEVAVGEGSWTDDGPLGASGARADPSDDADGQDGSDTPGALPGAGAPRGTVLVDVRFLDTPHLLHLRCALDDGTFAARWETEPLHSNLAHLRRPEDAPAR